MAYALEINMIGQKVMVFVRLLMSMAKSKNGRNANEHDCQHLRDDKLQNSVILKDRRF